MTAPDTLKIAAAQYPIDQPQTLFDWQDKIEQWVADGAKTGADLLVFPEYAAIEQAATFGPEIACDLKKTLSAVASVAGERIAFHAELAAKHKVHILVGSGPLEHSDGRITNAAQLVTPAGAVGTVNKKMMTPFERDWGVEGGEGLHVFDTNLGRIGVAICYDCEFPLLVHALSTSGCELILVPSCTERVSGAHRIGTAARARALENTCAVVTSPTVGNALWSPAVDINVGRAGFYVPAEHGLSDDGVIVEGSWNEPGWVSGQIDFSHLRRLTDRGEMHNRGDWSKQPGGDQVSPDVEVVDLR